MKKLVFVTIGMVLLSILSGCLGGSEEPKTYTLIDETTTINADESLSRGFELLDGAEIVIELKVIHGGAIDAFLVDRLNDVKYSYLLGSETGDFEYIVGGSSFNTNTFSGRFAVPSGRYYLVVDNTPIPDGGAAPTGSVDVKIKIIAIYPIEEGQIGQVATLRAAVK